MPSEKSKYVEPCTKVHTMWEQVKICVSQDKFSKSKTEAIEIPEFSETLSPEEDVIYQVSIQPVCYKYVESCT